jgi:uncharacterized SAM-binding protein YcdF (DUF218 family)
LGLLGRALVHDDGPARAQIAIVLAGDGKGGRILKAAELVRDGYVPQILVSGPAGFYGSYESELAIPFAVRHGYPREWFIPIPNESHSTGDEAVAMLTEVKRRQISQYLLVTSDFHTGRASRIYRSTARKMGLPPPVRVVAAPDEHYRSGAWWRTREGLKAVVLEWSKTLATAVGI